MPDNYGFFIGGQWEKAKDREYFETTNPATGEVLAHFPKGKKEDVRRAIKSASGAYPKWRAVPPPIRGEILLEAARILESRKEEMGALVTKEMGKVIGEGKGDVQEAIDFLKFIAGEGRRLRGETTPSELPQKACMTVRQPKGVVACITPWNFPVAIPSWKLGAALLCGNTVVFKPASDTPLCAAKFVEVLHEAGVTKGALNMVTGPGGELGGELVTNPAVRSVSFTGGVPAGLDVYGRSARRLVHVHLELGGKNPIIVMDDANLDLALEGILFAAYGTSGQRCTATSRIIVHEKVYDEVIARLIEKLKRFRVGNPLDPAVGMGPVVSASQVKTVMEYIGIGKKEAKLLYGGERLTGREYDKGHFVQPALFEAKHGARITKEEIFGPVLAAIRVGTFDEAVKVANDVEFGLSSSIYTRNIGLAYRAIDVLEAGITYINAPTIGAEVHLPFGGIKNTGIGGREAGSTAIEEFSEIKTVFIDYSDKLQKAQIDRD